MKVPWLSRPEVHGGGTCGSQELALTGVTCACRTTSPISLALNFARNQKVGREERAVFDLAQSIIYNQFDLAEARHGRTRVPTRQRSGGSRPSGFSPARCRIFRQLSPRPMGSATTSLLPAGSENLPVRRAHIKRQSDDVIDYDASRQVAPANAGAASLLKGSVYFLSRKNFAITPKLM